MKLLSSKYKQGILCYCKISAGIFILGACLLVPFEYHFFSSFKEDILKKTEEINIDLTGDLKEFEIFINHELKTDFLILCVLSLILGFFSFFQLNKAHFEFLNSLNKALAGGRFQVSFLSSLRPSWFEEEAEKSFEIIASRSILPLVNPNPIICINEFGNVYFYNEVSLDFISDEGEGRIKLCQELYNLRLKKDFQSLRISMDGHDYLLRIEKIHKNTAFYLTDITEQTSAERSMAQAKKEVLLASSYKDIFLANMSHEIRTPLHGMMGMHYLLSQTDLNKKQKNYMNSIKECGENLSLIINDILDFSKMEAGKLEVTSSDSRLLKPVLEVIKLLKHKASQKGVSLIFSHADNLPEFVHLDTYRLKQILLNLINNSIKFTHEGEVKVSIHYEKKVKGDHLLRFEILDTGIGIEKKSEGNLFQSFAQADSSATREYGGTGLGLAICKKLVKLMGGEIGYNSIDGVGTIFYFTVIAGISTCCEEEKVELIPDQFSKNCPLDILIVEDNLTNQKIIDHLLKKMGYAPTMAINGQEAVDLVKMRDRKRIKGFDLILMDMKMPVLDGIQATMEILKSNLREKTFISALTANAFEDDKKKCLKAGMDYFLTKPLKRGALISVLESVYFKKEKKSA